MRGCEHYGRKDYSSIAKECERTVEDVKQYAHIFWSRGPKQIAGTLLAILMLLTVMCKLAFRRFY